MKRREFLSGSLLAAAGLPALAKPAPAGKQKTESAPRPPEDTPPTVQAPSPDSAAIVWGVNRLCTGAVEYAERPDFSDKRTAFAGGLKQRGLDDRVLSVRLTGLSPATTYYYRTVTQPISAPDAYRTRRDGDPSVGTARSFRTPGENAPSSFAVINDTHENMDSFSRLMVKVNALNPSALVWNGDICNQLVSEEQAVRILLKPAELAYAAGRPLLYLPGNHDYRGIWSRRLEKIMIPRRPEERAGRHAELTRNFALRLGDIAMIGLDTGEDKPDNHPVWAGLANFEPYRELQTRWLAEALERPEIKTAPYLVAFCHIPLFDSRPDANPGNLLTGYADWQRPCAEMWLPLLERHGMQALIAGHTHQFRSDAPAPGRPWRQIVGGGPDLRPGREVTVIHGEVKDGRLRIAVHNVVDQKILGTYSFAPRA